MPCNQDTIVTMEDKHDSCTLLCMAFTQTPSSSFVSFLKYTQLAGSIVLCTVSFVKSMLRTHAFIKI